jgi:hypothetical protein
MNVKSGCGKAEAGRRRDAALRRQTHMNMSKTRLQTQKRVTAAPTHLRDYYAYGFNLCHSTYRKLIEADTRILRGDFEPDMPTKPLQPFLRFYPALQLQGVRRRRSCFNLFESLLEAAGVHRNV